MAGFNGEDPLWSFFVEAMIGLPQSKQQNAVVLPYRSYGMEIPDEVMHLTEFFIAVHPFNPLTSPE
ncbi:MAG: hypothetical protein K9K88_01490 [Desulfobacterales bacterium]|nr:hypothetical protein [Desulfobacterales bacterium]